MKHRLFVLALACFATVRFASAHDTNIVLGDCKLTSFDTQTGKWRTIPGEFQVLECDSGPGQLECSLRTASGEATPQTFTWHLDSPLARLGYQGDSWGDVLYIDPVSHRAVITTRLLSMGSLGTKTCSGLVLDEDEYARLLAQAAASRTKPKKRR